MKNNHKQKLITEVVRIKELMLLKEAVTPIPLLRTAIGKLIDASSPYLKMWDEIFQGNTSAQKKAVNSTRDALSNKASFNNIEDDTLQLLLNARNSKLFANMILDAWGLNKQIDNIFIQIERTPPALGQSVDYAAIKKRIMRMVDKIPELDTIEGLRDQISSNIDEAIELSKKGDYALSRGLYESLSMDQMFRIMNFSTDQVNAVKRITGFEDNFTQWMKGTNGRQIDEVADELRIKISEKIDSLKSKSFEQNWLKLQNQKTMKSWEKLLDNTKIWLNEKYGTEFVNSSGVIEKRSWFNSFGRVLFSAFIIDVILSNTMEAISAIAPGEDFDMQYGHLQLLLAWLIGFSFSTASETKEILFQITVEDAKKFANSNEYLKGLLTDPKNRYLFEKAPDDEIVKMLNFSDDVNRDPDFAIAKDWDSNFKYVEIKPQENKETILDKIKKEIETYD